MKNELKRYRLKALVLSLGMVAGTGFAVAQDNPAPKDEKGALEWASMKERVEALEQKLSKSGPGGWPAWFELGGTLELEYTDADGDFAQDTSNNPSPHFQLDKFVLKPEIKLTKNSKLYNEIEFTDTTARYEKGWYQIDLEKESGLYTRVGLLNRFTKADGKFDMANRKTEGYPLGGNANWRDQHYGWEWGAKHKFTDQFAMFWRGHFGDGLELSENHPNENDTWEITQDDDRASDRIKNKRELAGGLGFEVKFSSAWKFDLAGWYFRSNLNNDERARLAARAGYATDTEGDKTALDVNAQGSAVGLNLIDDEQHRWGVRTTHKFWDATTVTFEKWGAQDGKWLRGGWYGQASHLIKFKDPLINGEFLTSVEPVYRFEEYRSFNLDAEFSDPETWDRKQQVYALLVGISESNKLKSLLKLEYYNNHAKTGATGIDPMQPMDPENNEYLAQIQINF
ncbi:MAG: hypothetical protein AB7F75_07395 [Planctomycetota bacterium]